MIDTDATHTLITRSFLEAIPHPPIKKTSTITATLGDAHTTISVYGIVPLCIYVNHIPTYTSAFVIDPLGIDVILGMDWCRTYNVIFRIHQQEPLLHHPQYGQKQ